MSGEDMFKWYSKKKRATSKHLKKKTETTQNVVPQQAMDFLQKIHKMRQQLSRGDITLQSIGANPKTISEDILDYVWADVITQEQQAKIRNLKPGGSLYVKKSMDSKKKGSPERTYCVACDDNGNIHLYLETNSKLVSNTKRQFNKPSGSYKKVKQAYRIDTIPIVPTASMLITEDYPELKKEVKISNKLASKYPRFFSAFIKAKDHKGRSRLYQEYLGNDLYSVLEADNDELELDRKTIQIGKRAVEAWKLDIIHQLLQATACMHAEGIANNDMKTENVLCRYDPQQKRFVISIVDHGFAKTFQSRTLFGGGTAQFMPPESYYKALISIYVNEIQYRPLNNPQKKKILMQALMKIEKESGSGYGLDIAKTNLQNCMDIDKFMLSLEGIMPNLPGYSGQHDVWSLGVMIYNIIDHPFTPHIKDINEMYNALGEFPLEQMLNPNPQKRCYAEQALLQLKKMRLLKELPKDDTKQPYTQQPLDISNAESIDAFSKKIIEDEINEDLFKDLIEKYNKLMTPMTLNMKVIDKPNVIQHRLKLMLKNALSDDKRHKRLEGHLSHIKEKYDSLVMNHEIYPKLKEIFKEANMNDDEWIDIQRAKMAVSYAYHAAQILVTRMDPNKNDTQKSKDLKRIRNDMHKDHDTFTYRIMFHEEQQKSGRKLKM